MPKAVDKPMIRRSFALPRPLVKQAQTYLAPDKRENLNGLLKLALEEFVRLHRYEEFRRSVQVMAQDPRTVAEHKRVMQEFAGTDGDGIK